MQSLLSINNNYMYYRVCVGRTWGEARLILQIYGVFFCIDILESLSIPRNHSISAFIINLYTGK